MRARTRSRLRIVVAVTLASAVFGAVLSQDFETARLAGNAAAGGLAGFVLAVFEIVLQGPLRAALEDVPVGLVFVFRVLVYGAVFRAVTPVAIAAARALGPATLVDRPAGVGIGLANSLALALLFNTIFAARALMGHHTLIAFVTGRYHRPRREERIVLFLDLRGSTGLAERLGDQDFHRFLNRVFVDLAEPVAETAGEIYRYIGDEVIVTWRVGKGGEAAAALRCLFDIDAVLRRGHAGYEAEFGEAPRLRGALHAGPVITGEMGSFKREIVMLGDTMNTAARIVEACRSTGHEFITSAAALRAASPLPPQIRAESLGPMPLRGKEVEIELFALSASGDAVLSAGAAGAAGAAAHPAPAGVPTAA
jgi:adenylate cyclase